MMGYQENGAWRTCALIWATTLFLTGCTHAGVSNHSDQRAVPSLAMDAYGMSDALMIQGYNYTNDYIDSFTVNGQGGGNLFVSGPSSGGGKSVCCISYTPGMPLPIRLKVRWVGAYCMEYETSPYGRTNSYRRSLWRESEAQAIDLSEGRPRALEVHIFPDGRIEAAITRGHSRPRLILPEDDQGGRPGVKNIYSDCTNDQLKQPRY